MKNYAQELFLLITTLSQLNNVDRIIKLFIESLNDVFRGYSFSWLPERPVECDTIIEVCTRNKNFGYISFTTNGPIDNVIFDMIRNTSQFLALLLEKIEQDKMLMDQKNHLQVLVDERTNDLHKANLQLEDELTDRKQAEAKILKQNRIYAVLSNINQAILRIHETKELLNKTCRIVIDDGKFRMVWIGMVNFKTNNVDVVASNGFSGDYLEKIKIDLKDELRSSGPTGIAIKTGKFNISNDILNDDSMVPWREDALKYDYKSCVSFPLVVFNKVKGAFAIYSNEVAFFEEDDIKLLNEVAKNISFALEFIEMESERERTEKALAESAARYHSLFENAPVSLWEENFSSVKNYIDILKASGVSDFRTYFEEHPEEVNRCVSAASIVAVNQTTLKLFKTDSKELLSEGLSIIFGKESFDIFKEELITLAGGDTEFQSEAVQKNLLNEKIHTIIRVSIAPGYENSWEKVLVSISDITDRKNMEKSIQTHTHYLESLEQIDIGFKREEDVEKMLSSMLEKMLSIFNCDRVWLFFPCDPNMPSFRVPVEINRPEYPGANAQNIDVPMSPDLAQNLRDALGSEDPITYIAGTERPVNKVSAEMFGVKSQMMVPIYPKLGKPWVFGMHQCSHARIWTAEEKQLFLEISRRIADALTSLLSYQKLKESEERFRRLAENAQDVIYRMSIPDGQYEYVSPAALSVFGYSPHEFYITPTLFKQSIHPDWNTYFEEQWANLLKGNMPPTYEYQFIHKSGEVRWLNQRNILVIDDAGNPIAIEGIVTDITERKHTEDVLRLNEGRYRMAQTISHTGSWEYNLQTTHFWGSDEAKWIYGFDLVNDSFTTEEVENCILERERVHQALIDLIQENIPYDLEFEILPKNSSKSKIITSIAELQRDEHGNPLRVVGVIQDITERKQIENSLKESENQLKEAQRIGKIGSWDLDIVNNILTWSDEIYRMFEIDPKKFGASFEAFLEAVHPDDQEAVNFAYTNSLTTRTPYMIEHRLRFADGRIKHVQEQCETFYDANSKPLRSIGTVQDITDRKQAEEKLHSASLYARSLIEASLDPLVTISPNGKITDVNHATEMVTGESRESLIGNDFSDYFTEPEKAKEGYQQVFKKGLVRDYPLTIRHKSGHLTDVLYNATIYRNKSGEIQGVFAAARDITERKQTEQKLFQLAAIVQSSDDAIISKNLDGTIFSWNKGAEKIYGYTESEVIGKPISILYTPRQIEEAQQILQKIMGGEHIVHFETMRRRKDGQDINVSLTISPILDTEGSIIAASTIARDITGHKQMEEALFFVAQRGWQTGAENFFDALVQFLGEKLDMDYVLIDKIDEDPDMAETVAMYAKGTIVPNMRYALKGTPCENVMGQRLCVYQHGIQQLFPEDTLLPGMGAESYGGIPLWDSTGRPIGLIAVIDSKPLTNDVQVTQLLQLVAIRAAAELERKHDEQEILKLNQELEQRVFERTIQLENANKELEAFSYSVSHDLRSPLRAIEGFSRFLYDDYYEKLDDEAKRLLNIIKDNTRKMDQLITDLLALSRVTRSELKCSRIDMTALAKSMYVEIISKDLKKEFEFEVATLPDAYGDGNIMRQVWINLISNAIKFSLKSKIRKIEIGYTNNNGINIYYIKDKGVGFDDKYKHKLFGVFQRLHSSDEFEGTGVGLAIVQRIIHRHGGEIWAEAKINKGATFYFTLGAGSRD